MEFSFHTPPPALADSIKAIWCARGTMDEFAAPEPIVPDGCVEMVFNLGDRFIDAGSGMAQPRDLLAGQMMRPVMALPTGAVDLIGVRFHTARAGTALRQPMFEFQDRLVAASSVLTGLDQIVDDLRSTDRERRVELLATTLARRLGRDTTPPEIDAALAMIASSRGRTAIETVARTVGVGRRQLERRFREYVGLSAKQLARISRVHHVLRLLRDRPELSGAEIAVVCGHSDQAHMIRECQQLAGQTPQRLRTAERSLAGLMRSAT